MSAGCPERSTLSHTGRRRTGRGSADCPPNSRPTSRKRAARHRAARDRRGGLGNRGVATPTELSTTARATPATALAEVVATAGLVLLITGLARAGRPVQHVAAAVAAYIGAAYWFTSSTSFANPAVTVGRIFTDTFAGIAPASVLPFVAAQLLGAGFGIAVAALLFPHAMSETADLVAEPVLTEMSERAG